MAIRFSVSTLTLGLALVGCAASNRTSAPIASRDSLVQFADGVQPGCARGVFGPGSSVRYSLGGYADITTLTPITENTQFLAASASKQFTALAILHLAADGRLRLDDPARRWVPELAGAVQDATIEQLLHHTAGVRDHVNLLLLSGVEALGPVDRVATMVLMARQRTTNFPPGERAQYSNGNYLMLSEIVARASGEPLERYAERVIFAPLHMTDTQFLSDHAPRALAQGYQPQRDPPGFHAANDRPATNGSGGLITTIADLQKFDADFRAERFVWRPEIKRQMLTPGRLSNGEIAILPEFGTTYGMGLGLAEVNGDVRVFHDGGAEGFRAEYVRLLNNGVSVAVLCNRVDARAPAMADEALRAAANLPAPTDEEQSQAPGAPSSAPPRALLEAIAGRYRAEELDTEYVFETSDDGFEVTIISPFTRNAPVNETWGGLRVTEDGEIRSGPIRLAPRREGDLVHGMSLSFGRRVEGVRLERIRAN